MMPFIVTLGMMGIARGVAKWIAKSQIINAPDSSINTWMAQNDPDHFFPLPPGVWIAIGLACLMSLVMRHTIFGRYIFAIGSNEAAARLCGIRVQLQKVPFIRWPVCSLAWREFCNYRDSPKATAPSPSDWNLISSPPLSSAEPA